MSSIYYQETLNNDLEFSLIQKVTIRETLIKKFKLLEKNILLKKEIYDIKNILKSFNFLNLIRQITIEILQKIKEYQKMFTISKRPIILKNDYLLSLISSTEFLNISRIRKYFNFAIMRGNIFILPITTGKSKERIVINQEIMNEIETFINPNMNDLIFAYTILKDSLPNKNFQDILSLQRWIQTIWIPNVKVSILPSLTTSFGTSTKGINNQTSQSLHKKPFVVSPSRHSSPRLLLNNNENNNDNNNVNRSSINRQTHSAPAISTNITTNDLTTSTSTIIPITIQSPLPPPLSSSCSPIQSKSKIKTSKKIKNNNSSPSNNSQQLSPLRSTSQLSNKKMNVSVTFFEDINNNQQQPQPFSQSQSNPMILSTTQLREWYLKNELENSKEIVNSDK